MTLYPSEKRNKTMQVFFFKFAVMLSGLSVGLGAFAAHGLKQRLSPEMLDVFKTGVQYQFYHALALLALSLASTTFWQQPATVKAASCWVIGIALFSGSLYALSLSGISKLGAITPIGGVALLLGWAFLFFASRGLIDTPK